MSFHTDITGVQGTARWFKDAVPAPADTNIHTQLGVHFEEICEMIDAITAKTSWCRGLLWEARQANHALANYLKGNEGEIEVLETDRTEFLDAICDQIVTAVGCAHMQNMDVAGGLDEVNRSNFSKFDAQGDPIFGPNRKIMKGTFYSPAQLAEFAV